MASNLTIVSSTTAPRPFGAQSAQHQDATTEATGLLGIFGALLAAKDQPVATTAPSPSGETGGATTDFDLAALLAGLAAGDEEDKDAEDQLIGALELPLGDAAPVETKPMLDFIDAIAALKESLDRGEPLDADLLAQAEAALDLLAGAMGLDLSQLPAPTDFAGLIDAEGTAPEGLAGVLSRLLAPLSQSMADNGDQPVNNDAVVRLNSLSDKLGAMLAALKDGAISEEQLAKIGMPLNAEMAPDIEEALTRFAESLKAAPAVVPDAPELATPALKLSEPVLTGKSESDTSEPVQPAPKAEAVAPDEDRDRGNDRSDTDRRSAERPEPTRPERTANTAPQAAAEPAAPAQATASTGEAASPRVDGVTAPRVIQAGYQTSQQQLNLPQIAFELARQVQDGNTRFQIRLDPPELGRIDVRLDIDKGGQVNARLTVEKAETLDLMQRDQRALERALAQAGLEGSKANLEFSLKQNPFSSNLAQGDREGSGGEQGDNAANGSGEPEAEPLPTVNLYRGALQASGLNIIA